MNNRDKQKKVAFFKILLHTLYVISFILYFYYLYDGFDYYTTPYQERPRHEDYRNLRPAGFRSHAFGIIGSAYWDWKRVTFILLSLCSFYISLFASEHYLHSHIWDHIIKRHLFRVFLWTFGILFLIQWGMSIWDMELFINSHIMWVLLIGGLIGIVPESGPHLIFVMMYSGGLVPFSVLFTSSFVQDGHGMLPMLSYSLKDSLLIKVFNLTFALAVGSILYGLGL